MVVRIRTISFPCLTPQQFGPRKALLLPRTFHLLLMLWKVVSPQKKRRATLRLTMRPPERVHQFSPARIGTPIVCFKGRPSRVLSQWRQDESKSHHLRRVNLESLYGYHKYIRLCTNEAHPNHQLLVLGRSLPVLLGVLAQLRNSRRLRHTQVLQVCGSGIRYSQPAHPQSRWPRIAT